jgi:hypothetical protein
MSDLHTFTQTLNAGSHAAGRLSVVRPTTIVPGSGTLPLLDTPEQQVM